MGYGIQNLRRSAIFDQLTPGSSPNANIDPGFYRDDIVEDGRGIQAPDGSPLDQSPHESIDTRILGPDGTPLTEEPTGLAKLADTSVDPNKGNEMGRLKGYLDTIQGAYTPDYKSRDRNDRLLDEAPTRGQPTNWDRTAAILMSLGKENAADIQEKVLQAPYYRDAADWKMKTEPFYKAAELENRQNINERTLVTNSANTYSAAERNRIAEENNNRRNEVATIRANAEAAKANRWTVKVVGPDVIAYSPDGQNSRKIGSSGNLTQEDKINLEGQWKVEAAKEAAAGANARSDAAGAQVFVDPTTQQPRTVNPRTGQGMNEGPIQRVPSASTGGGAKTNTLETRRQEQDLMKLQTQLDPENAKKHMKSDGKGNLTWNPRPVVGATVEGWFGNRLGGREVTQQDVDAYDAARLEANPNYKPPSKGLGPSSSAPPNSNKVKPIGPSTVDNGSAYPSKDINGPQKTTGQNYRLKQNPKNPNEKVRSFDGGKTWEKSTDGGKTWR